MLPSYVFGCADDYYCDAYYTLLLFLLLLSCIVVLTCGVGLLAGLLAMNATMHAAAIPAALCSPSLPAGVHAGTAHTTRHRYDLIVVQNCGALVVVVV